MILDSHEANIYNDQGNQNIIEEIFKSIRNIDDRISTRHVQKSELLITSFSEPTVVRQIVPGQLTLMEPPVIVPADKSISYSLDLSAGNSEDLMFNTIIRVRMALTNLEYKKATFIAYNKPIYQGKGIYCIQWGLMAEI